MRTLIGAVAGVAIAAFVAVALLAYRPTTYRVEGVRVSCDHEVRRECPSREDWRAFAIRECQRWIDAGEMHTLGECWRVLDGVRWRYVSGGDDGLLDGARHAQSSPWDSPPHSEIVIRHALTPGTDGHEMRLQIAHVLWGDRPEREDMRRMSERGVYDY